MKSFVVTMFLRAALILLATILTRVESDHRESGPLISDNGGQLSDQLVSNLMIPRVSGSQGNVRARQFITQELEGAGIFSIETDSFKSNTPIGRVQFTNIVARLEGESCETIVLAAHHDSKLTTSADGKSPELFVGMTDSAVPCAILLQLAQHLAPLYHGASNSRKPKYSIEFIFFDGEEALRQWSATDSLYGSRHLAQKWSRPGTGLDCTLSSGRKPSNRLQTIRAFILLDLIGAKNPQFRSFYRNTNSIFQQLISTQNRIAHGRYFLPYAPSNFNGIDDDHKPFEQRGVPIVHLISTPFPNVWHKLVDNAAAYDRTSSSEIYRILLSYLKTVITH